MLHRPVSRFRQSRAREFVIRGLTVLLLGAALSLSHSPSELLNAQVLSPPVQLGPTVAALDALHKCGENAARNARSISDDILDAQQTLYVGLVKGGYDSHAGAHGTGYGPSTYPRGINELSEGYWMLVPPPKDYVDDLTREAQWCLQVAQILNTDPNRKDAAKQVLASIAKDLEIKAKDCKDWGAGRLVTVIANTIKNGQPDPGWTVMYKWISVSGLNAVDLAFPQISTPTSKGVPPGVYSVYATKQVGNATVKTPPVTVSAFQNQKVKCEITVP
jgi:hypothetical protein